MDKGRRVEWFEKREIWRRRKESLEEGRRRGNTDRKQRKKRGIRWKRRRTKEDEKNSTRKEK